MDSVRKEKSGWQNLFMFLCGEGPLESYCTSEGKKLIFLVCWIFFFVLNEHSNK